MKKSLLLSILLLAAMLCMAQHENLPVENINGQACYRYPVKKSEGLYRISKEFGVSQEEIIKYNPKLQTEGLKYGQEIYIPVTTATSSTTTTATSSTTATATSKTSAQTAATQTASQTVYTVHVVQKGETIYGLTHRYGISQEALEAANPQLSKGLQAGMTLRIPKASSEEKTVQQTAPQAETVQKTQEPSAMPAVVQKAKEEQVKTEVPAAATVVAKHEEKPVYHATISAIPLRIAYLLPLMAETTKRDITSDRFVDFYEGSLLAIYEAQEAGQTFDIYTYDVQKTDVAVQQVFRKGEMQMVDMIIGPAYPNQVGYAGMFAKQNRIPMLVPFTSKVSGIEHNPYMMQFNPSSEAEADAIAHSLMNRKDSVRFVVVDADASDAAASAKAMLQTARDSGFQVVTISTNAIINDSLESALDPRKENILVFNSEKYSAVQVLVKKLTKWCGLYSLTLFGHYSWTEEKTALPMIYASVFHTLNLNKAQQYDALYNRYFGHAHASDHPRYDLLGYDLTRSMIRALQSAQNVRKSADADVVYERTYEGLQSDLSFRRISQEGGLINTNIRVYRK